MTQRQSHTYTELERVADGFDPKQVIAIQLLLTADEASVSSNASVHVQRELAELCNAAAAFKVLITCVYDDVENSAFVTFRGRAGYVGDVAAFMASAKAASAR